MVSGGLPGGLEVLNEAVERLDIAPATDELIEAMQAMDGLRAKVVEALSVFLRCGGPAADGFSNHRSWLRAHVAITDRDAALLVTWAKRAVDWPVLAKLWFDGHLSGAQYAVVCGRVTGTRLVELYADHDAEVSPLLVGLSVTDTRTAIDQWATMAESVTAPDPAEAEIPETGDPIAVDGELKVSRYGDAEKRLAINGDLDPDSGTIVQQALSAAMPKLVEGDTRSHAQRVAEAWVRICAFYLAHPDLEGGGGPAAHMIVVAELADLYRNALWGLGIHTAEHLDRFLAVNPVPAAEEGWLRDALAHSTGVMRTLDGWPLTPAAITSLFGAGSTLERLMLADGQILDHGRKTRLFKGGLRTVVKVRDKCCRYRTQTGETCDSPVAWTHVHHPTPWDEGGCTSHLNGMLLCPTHHALVHSLGWTTVLDPDGTVHFHRPDGTVITSPPPWATRPPRLPLHHPHIDAIPKHLPDEPTGPSVPDDAGPRGEPDQRAGPPETHEAIATGLPDVLPDASRPPGIDHPTEPVPDEDHPDRPGKPGRTLGWHAPAGFRSTIRIADPTGPDEADTEPGQLPSPELPHDQAGNDAAAVDPEPAEPAERAEPPRAPFSDALDWTPERAEQTVAGLDQSTGLHRLVHRSGSSTTFRRERSPDLVVRTAEGGEIRVRLTTAA